MFGKKKDEQPEPLTHEEIRARLEAEAQKLADQLGGKDGATIEVVAVAADGPQAICEFGLDRVLPVCQTARGVAEMTEAVRHMMLTHPDRGGLMRAMAIALIGGVALAINQAREDESAVNLDAVPEDLREMVTEALAEMPAVTPNELARELYAGMDEEGFAEFVSHHADWLAATYPERVRVDPETQALNELFDAPAFDGPTGDDPAAS